jgi:glyoxylase-like metal-dependent hydrolase (beta-lactamase superfamily II)
MALIIPLPGAGWRGERGEKSLFCISRMNTFLFLCGLREFSASPFRIPSCTRRLASPRSPCNLIECGRGHIPLPRKAKMTVAETIDVEYLGHSRAIAACLLESDGQFALVDPGPSVSLPVLRRKLQRRGIAIGDLTALFLTHIHLDHAGATGTLVRENPRLRVYVHEFGTRHMVDPSKLLASAGRLYNPGMEQRFGEFLPVPRENIVALKGGEEIALGSRRFEVLYTPGHASHHVTWFERAAGHAFVGDTAGIRIEGASFVVPVTPPPDIDLPAWHRSLDAILSHNPSRLFLTHFGWSENPAEHFGELRERLENWAAHVREMLARDETMGSGALGLADPGVPEFSSWAAREIRSRMAPELAAHYVAAAGLDLSWLGLARYWRKGPSSATEGPTSPAAAPASGAPVATPTA